MTRVEGYLKKHAEALVKDVGIEAAARLTGKSRATPGRCYSTDVQHANRFMTIHFVAQVDAVAQVEAAARDPHVTSALAELRKITLALDRSRRTENGGVNSDAIVLSQRFAVLMGT